VTWISNNSKYSLEITEKLSQYSFGMHLVPCCWTWDVLHQYRPRRISSMVMIVAHCEGISIHRVVASQNISTRKPIDKMRHLQDLMKWREPGSPKKQCQIHEYSKATTSRTLVGSRLFLVAHCVTSISLCPLSWELEDRPTQIHESSRTHTHTCT
jgi:hypothetical protein